MKYGRVETEKIYFSSSEAAEQIGVPVSLLHSWEKEHVALKPKKDRAGKRFYKPNDIEIAKKIKEELSNGTPFKELTEIKPKPKTSKKAKNTNNVSKESLLKIRNDLQQALLRIHRN
ncbi:MAG: MerR family transcriptional regulator [Fibromonadaceae bacterium]|jgi:DNA-binding transcriptional MerR regulator|nr:MerR family transcriptional regulator [Fibromonadaceae bacterium]